MTKGGVEIKGKRFSFALMNVCYRLKGSSELEPAGRSKIDKKESKKKKYTCT